MDTKINYYDDFEDLDKVIEEIIDNDYCDYDFNYNIELGEITSEDVLTFQGYYFDYWGGNN